MLLAVEAISDYDLFALLRLCNTASRDVNTNIEQLSTNQQLQAYCESAFELCRKPLWATFTNDDVEYPLKVPPETLMGPTSFARILTLLAQRGLLDNIHRMTRLPEGGSAGSRTSLSKVKEIARQDNIRRFLILARKRVTARREEGHSRFKSKELDYACLAYTTAAELAAALIAFDEATTGVTTNGFDSKYHGKYSQQLLGVRKELVLCLGNAAEMCLGLQKYERALPLAMAATDAVSGLPMVDTLDAVDESIRAKNLRRVERAKTGQQIKA